MDNAPLETAFLAALDLTDAAREALRDLPFDDSRTRRKAYNFSRRIREDLEQLKLSLSMSNHGGQT